MFETALIETIAVYEFVGGSSLLASPSWLIQPGITQGHWQLYTSRLPWKAWSLLHCADGVAKE